MFVSPFLDEMVMLSCVLGHGYEMSHVLCFLEMILFVERRVVLGNLWRHSKKSELLSLLSNEFLINGYLRMVSSSPVIRMVVSILLRNFSRNQNQKKHHPDSELSESISSRQKYLIILLPSEQPLQRMGRFVLLMHLLAWWMQEKM